MSTIVKNSANTPPHNENTGVHTAGTVNKSLSFVDDLSGYKVHHDDTDIRNFDVKLATGETIGEVEGLLADVAAKFVRYVEIEIEDDVINKHTAGRYTSEDRHVLVPVGLIAINSDKSVTINGLGFEHLVDYPRFNRSHGYTTGYELDTNNYLSDFHEYGSTYDRSMFDNDEFRRRDTVDPSFYQSKFYIG